MNRRKQILQVKEDMTSVEPEDPFICSNGNSSWFNDDENSSFDITPSLTSISEDFLHLLDFPLDLDSEPLSQENKEVFQDLQFTSTPKSRLAPVVHYDSGIEESTSSKKVKTDSSSNTLHDITDKFDSSCNSFINLSQLSDNTSCNNTNKKPVTVVKKDVISKSNNNHYKVVTPEELSYYTGIKNHNVALAILKHLKMPKGKFSSFKMEFITLTKMRLNLQWKDMSFRFSIPEKDLYELTLSTINVMNYSFDDLLPWHVQRKVLRRTVKCMYGHTLFCETTGIQVLVLFVDSKRPVLFVSSAYPLDKPPIHLLNDCYKNLIPGDVICLCDLQGNRNYYKVEHSITGLSVACLDESSLVSCPFVENCQKILLDILSDFSIILKPENGMDLVKLIKIAGALTNLNSMNDINSSILGRIYQRSVQYISKSLV